MQTNSPNNYNANETAQQGMVGELGTEQRVDELRRDVKTKGVQLLTNTVDALFPEEPQTVGNAEVASDLGVQTFPIFGGAAAIPAEVRGQVDVAA